MPKRGGVWASAKSPVSHPTTLRNPTLADREINGFKLKNGNRRLLAYSRFYGKNEFESGMRYKLFTLKCDVYRQLVRYFACFVREACDV